jgi:hypothetical protein
MGFVHIARTDIECQKLYSGRSEKEYGVVSPTIPATLSVLIIITAPVFQPSFNRM